MTERKSVVAWGWMGKGDRKEGLRKLFEVIDMFIILTVVINIMGIYTGKNFPNFIL